jgi:anti-sigma factor RsiW
MTQKDLSEEWAWTQLEAWVDGSLTGESRARMDAAIAADPRLRAAAERAVAVQRALRAGSPVHMPRGLRRRLLAIPSQAPRSRRSFLRPALASAAAAAAVIAGVLWLRPQPTELPPDAGVVAAAQDLEIAMRYLQKSASITQGHVTSAVGTGLRDAFAVTREALEQDIEETGGEGI